METNRGECAVCRSDLIYKYMSQYSYFQRKIVCNRCREQLLTKRYEVLPVSKQREVEFVSEKRCEKHEGICELWCEECKEKICGKCMREHTGHRMNSLSSNCLTSMKDLNILNYLLKELLVLFPKKKILLHKIQNKRSNLCQLLTNSSSIDPSDFLKSVSSLFSEIQYIIPHLSNHPLSKAYTLLLSHKIPTPIQTIHHWTDWGSSSLHLVDIKTNTVKIKQFRLSSESSDIFVFPYYCKSVLLPNSKLFVCGGRENVNSFGLRSTWIIDLNTKGIESKSEMVIGRANHCVVYHNSFVYVIGGCNQQNQFSNVCEKYDLENDAWIQISSTNKVTDSAAALVVPRQNSIYVFCGREDNGVLNNTIERYDIHADYWTVLPVIFPIRAHLIGASLLSPFSNKILLFGGQNGHGELIGKSLIFNFKTLSISEHDKMKHNGGCIVENALVYDNYILASLFSGFDSRSYQIFSIGRKYWCEYTI
jgi:hypothetical protein